MFALIYYLKLVPTLYLYKLRLLLVADQNGWGKNWKLERQGQTIGTLKKNCMSK